MESMNKQPSRAKGFTLIEILVVIGLIAVLAAIVLIAINPGRQFAQARNSQRESNVNTILNAIGQRLADNKGVWKTETGCDALPDTSTEISDGDVDLSCLVPTYISTALPVDPSVGDWDNEDTYSTGYKIFQDPDDARITVCAPEHKEDAIEDSEEYCLTR
jgi:prepilin-type N-terminal cleavage/methylation domain-containing protein